MLIDESIFIHADIDKIWKTFTDLTCWADWNNVAHDVMSNSGRLAERDRFTFCSRPFSVPITLKPRIETVLSSQRVVWTGSKFGIFSRDEFLFQQLNNGVPVTSREVLRGLRLLFSGHAFTIGLVRKLNIAMLNDLKNACEGQTRA